MLSDVKPARRTTPAAAESRPRATVRRSSRPPAGCSSSVASPPRRCPTSRRRQGCRCRPCTRCSGTSPGWPRPSSTSRSRATTSRCAMVRARLTPTGSERTRPAQEAPALRRAPRRGRATPRPDPTRHPRGRSDRPGGRQGVAAAPRGTAAGHEPSLPGASTGRASPRRRVGDRSARRPVDLQLRGALPAARHRAGLVAQAVRPLDRRRAHRRAASADSPSDQSSHIVCRTPWVESNTCSVMTRSSRSASRSRASMPRTAAIGRVRPVRISWSSSSRLPSGSKPRWYGR